MAMKKPLSLITLMLSLVSAGCTGLFFAPDRDFLLTPEVEALFPREVFFNSPDGLRLHGMYLRHQGPARRGVVLVFHGNTENLSTHILLDLWLVRKGYDLFIFDYRGYSRSEGKATVEGIHLDAGAALETLLGMPETGGEKVIVYGKSLGGAVAVHTVAASTRKDRVRALIIESAFADYRMKAREEVRKTPTGWLVMYPAALLVDNRYSPLKWIGGVSPVPVLIIHGTDDHLVPVGHGRLLYETAEEPKQYWEIKGMGHIRAGDDPATRERLLEFMKQGPPAQPLPRASTIIPVKP
jgi:fermentation-respiration switch protein FrsA (DUF1100 family)